MLDETDRQMLWLCGAVFVFIVLLALTGWIVQSYFEASTYRRLTGKQVTTWDAMWVELRVQEEAMSRED